MGHLWPATGLSMAHEIVQQIQKNQQIFVKVKVKWPETLFPLNCLCWIMNVYVFINHAVYILHYLRVYHRILIGVALWCFMVHWCGPCPEKSAHHCLGQNIVVTNNGIAIKTHGVEKNSEIYFIGWYSSEYKASENSTATSKGTRVRGQWRGSTHPALKQQGQRGEVQSRCCHVLS